MKRRIVEWQQKIVYAGDFNDSKQIVKVSKQRKHDEKSYEVFLET